MVRVTIFAACAFLSLYAYSTESYIDQWRWNNGLLCALYLDVSYEDKIEVQWSGEGEPPINISKASEIAKNWVKQEYHDKYEIHIVSFNLKSYRAEGMSSNHWLYNIRFLKFENGSPAIDFQENIAVLMDGQVIGKTCN